MKKIKYSETVSIVVEDGYKERRYLLRHKVTKLPVSYVSNYTRVERGRGTRGVSDSNVHKKPIITYEKVGTYAPYNIHQLNYLLERILELGLDSEIENLEIESFDYYSLLNKVGKLDINKACDKVSKNLVAKKLKS